jgi:hypothetical protein
MIFRSHLPARLRLTNPQRATLATIGKRLGRQALEQVALVAKPETILSWYCKLIAQKFDGSKHRAYPGRPTVSQEITDLIVRMASREYRPWDTTFPTKLWVMYYAALVSLLLRSAASK